MTNVMLLGDTHGDVGFTNSAIVWAAENDVDRIVQVGDFGFWPRTNSGMKFLHRVGKKSVEMHVPLYFLDGNHDDHLVLASLRERHVPEGNMPDGFINYGKYPITYIDRGARWDWGGVWFGSFGGAFSMDRSYRTENSGHYGWFANEVPDESKIEALGRVDVLLTHDSPIVPPLMHDRYFRNDETSRGSQLAVYHALVASKAELLVHGHWHLNDQYRVHGATVQGLDMNQSSLYSAGVVFRTDDRRLFTLKQWEYRG